MRLWRRSRCDRGEGRRPERSPIPRASSFSRSGSGRSSRHGARDVTGRPSKRAACGWMRGQPSWPAARPARPSFPATPRRACWSTPSTMAKPTRCRRNRSCPPEEIATLTEWVQRGAPWGIDPPAVGGSAGTGKIPGALSKEEFQARARYWSFQPLSIRIAPAREAHRTPAGCATRSTASSWPHSNKKT